MTQCEAIIEALQALGGEATIKEVDEWLDRNYPNRWKGSGTSLADMVPLERGGNISSSVPQHFRVLERVGPGRYKLTYEL
ncbi:hypothetical protein D1B31_02140 [Neobacillus notoginsengisoli]|uniref:HTH HARE-type domain-containing protein n=1 Tax=Neobacillus notoginsengisoli TaxID=1578198 RepID=A0A417YZY3_9BACI|nr:hypothetical protein [Neobacillus notoginsengisoli]RHW43479.1 hypothetical protein D1B31_02140 [Neobacillus notoginsengisoli]